VQEQAAGGADALADTVSAVRWTATGLDLPETMTLEGLRSLLASFRAWESRGTVALADIFAFARARGWETEVEQMLSDFEFDPVTVRRSMRVGDVPRGLRHPDLTAEHYYVVADLTYPEQTKWLQKAVKHKMRPLVLKRSIEAGKVLTKEQIEMMSGAGSGIVNYHGILTNWKRWEKKVGGEEAVLSWPRTVLAQFVDEHRPIRDLVDKAEDVLRA